MLTSEIRLKHTHRNNRGYNPFMGCRSNGFMRASFINLLHEFLDQDYSDYSSQKVRASNLQLRKIAGFMWNCTDRLPVDESNLIGEMMVSLRHSLSSERSITYAKASRFLLWLLDFLEVHARWRENPPPISASIKLDIPEFSIDDILDGLDSLEDFPAAHTTRAA